MTEERRWQEFTEFRGEVNSEIENLKNWQTSQNGSLARINQRMDRILLLAIGVLCSSLGGSALLVVELLHGK